MSRYLDLPASVVALDIASVTDFSRRTVRRYFLVEWHLSRSRDAEAERTSMTSYSTGCTSRTSAVPPPILRYLSFSDAMATNYVMFASTSANKALRNADELASADVCCRNRGHSNGLELAAHLSTTTVRLISILGAVRSGPALATEPVITTKAAAVRHALDSRRLAVMFAIAKVP